VLTADAARDGLIQVVEKVFRAMLGTEIAIAAIRWDASPDSITATIDFSGAWRGVLCLQCSERQARQLAQLFIGEECGLSEEEVQDVMGELANIIAGNLKLMLPRGTQHGLPSIVLGQRQSDVPGPHKIAVETSFIAGKDRVSLTFTQQEK